jgi:chromosome segregation ATPase
MQVSIENEQRSQSEAREAYAMSERRCMILQGEVEEMRTSIESAERLRKSAENELHEANDRVNELAVQVTSIQAQKRKLEGDVQAMQVRTIFY